MKWLTQEIFKKSLLVLGVSFLIQNGFNAQTQDLNKKVQYKNDTSHKRQTITYKLINVKDQTYGYDIFVNNALFIHQPVIPCINGNEGFHSKSDAKKVAALVIEKIRKGIIPPTVTIPEMKKIGIILRE